MKKIFLAYNSRAGDANFSRRLHSFIDIFQKDFMIEINDIVGVDIAERLEHIDTGDYSHFIVAGGDGTVNSFINALMQNEGRLPVGILPIGTSNDFATYLKLPEDFREYFRLLQNEENVRPLDVGKINDIHFINVCACGFLTSVPYETPSDLKNMFGKLAYYLKGVQKLTELKPLPLKISAPEFELEDELCLFVILNSGRAGGFSDLVPSGRPDDGKFELLAIRYGGVYDMFTALMDAFINKEWRSNENIIFHRSDRFEVEYCGSEDLMKCDIDGEKGPALPLSIEVVERAIPFIMDTGKMSFDYGGKL